MAQHTYRIDLRWTGNRGAGTYDYRAYHRDHLITGKGKSIEIPGSSDPAFRGDEHRYNPEELLVASLASCHMLWYLHLCAVNGVVVTAYHDKATGEMAEDKDGSGRFKAVTLHPVVSVSNEGMIDRAQSLHAEAHRLCFIANSVNFPVSHEPSVEVAA